MNAALVSIEGLTKVYEGSGLFGRRRWTVQAVSDVSFEVRRGETLALVGESGCGKSSIARLVLRLTEPTAGRICFAGEPLAGMSGPRLKAQRRRMQIVFQDPMASLNPRKTIGHILGQPLAVHRGGRPAHYLDEIRQALALVGLTPPEQFIQRLPHEFSGGQRQRIAIARALMLRPELIVADEPVSALDVSIRAQILALMKRLQGELGLTYLFITHDLGVVRSIAHRVAVMYLGKIVEIGDVASIFAAPRHPYTAALLSASPIPDPEVSWRHRRIILKGDVPSPANPPSGCHFHPRCPAVLPICGTVAPVARELAPGHLAACHLNDPAIVGERAPGMAGTGVVEPPRAWRDPPPSFEKGRSDDHP